MQFIYIYMYAGGISGLYTWQILSAGCLGKFAAGCALQYPIQTACFAVFFLSAPSLICLISEGGGASNRRAGCEATICYRFRI